MDPGGRPIVPGIEPAATAKLELRHEHQGVKDLARPLAKERDICFRQRCLIRGAEQMGAQQPRVTRIDQRMLGRALEQFGWVSHQVLV